MRQRQLVLFPHQLVNAEAVTSFQLRKSSAHLACEQQLLQVVRHFFVVAHVDHLLVRDVVARAVQASRRARRLVTRGGLQSLGELEQLLWLDVGVGEKVGLQVRSLVETSLAHWASVRRLFIVQDLVNCKYILLDYLSDCSSIKNSVCFIFLHVCTHLLVFETDKILFRSLHI